MTTHPGFLAAILADPADDVVRLIYADWLEDQGEAERAEFIRVQCKIAKVLVITLGDLLAETYPAKAAVKVHKRVEPLRKRERELLVEAKGLWLPVINDLERVFRTGETECGWVHTVPASSPESYIAASFSRGFISALTCTASDWLSHADAITAAQPIERVTLTTWPTPEEIDLISPTSKRWPRIAFTLPGHVEMPFEWHETTLDDHVATS